jgi:hypothetical protein
VVSTTEPGGIGSDRASRFTASVVFLTNSTTSRPGSAPTNRPTTSRASSKAAVLIRDR